MAVTVSGFRARFGDRFSDETDDDIEAALETAVLIHALNDTATAYLAAHLLVTDLPDAAEAHDGGSGVVQSERIGPRTISYVNMVADGERKAWFATSEYGRRFLILEDRTPSFLIAARVTE